MLVSIALVCFFIWFIFFLLYFRLKTKICLPENLEEKLHMELSNWKEKKTVGSVMQDKKDFFSRAVSYIMQSTDAKDMTDCINEIYEKEISTFDRDIKVLSVLVSSAPLLGLLGTVWGMIETFQLISLKATYSSQMMSSGISKALITTQFGLIVALPGIFAVSFLKRKIAHLEVQFTSLKLHLTKAINRRKT